MHTKVSSLLFYLIYDLTYFVLGMILKSLCTSCHFFCNFHKRKYHTTRNRPNLSWH